MDDHLTEAAACLSVGQLLKQTRETSGISLRTAADTLRINISHLTKLEGDHDELTCDVYTLGFLRLYAQYLKLNPSELINQFKTQITALPSSEFIFPTPLPEQGTPHVRVVLISLGFFLLLAAGFGYHWWQAHRPHATLLDSLPKSTFLPATPPSPSSPQENPIGEAPSSPVNSLPEGAASTTHLKALEKTWVEVRDEQGTIVLRRLFFPGESYEFQNTANLTLTTGNAKGMEISSGDKVLTFPGEEVKRGISLNPQHWNLPLSSQQDGDPSAQTAPASFPSET